MFQVNDVYSRYQVVPPCTWVGSGWVDERSCHGGDIRPQLPHLIVIGYGTLINLLSFSILSIRVTGGSVIRAFSGGVRFVCGCRLPMLRADAVQ